MKIASLILSILATLFCLGLASVWLGDASDMKAEIEQLRAMGAADDIDAIIRAAYALFASAAMGVAALVLAAKGKGKVGAGLLLCAVVVPAIFSAKTLLATFLFGIAALLLYKVAQRSESQTAALG